MTEKAKHPIDALNLLLEQCGRSAIPFIQIRMRQLSEEIAFDGGDYDFLVAPHHLKGLLRLAQRTFSAAKTPFLIERKKRDKVVLRIYEATTGRSIILDIWQRLELRLPHKGTMAHINWSSLEPQITKTQNGYAFSQEFEAGYYLTHLHTKRKRLDNKEIQNRLQYYAESIKLDVTLSALFQRLGQGNLAEVANEAWEYLQSLGLRTDSQTTATLRERLYKQRMRYNARGNLIAFVGPDGVGKTTIIREYKQLLAGRVKYYRFKKLFRKALLYKLLLPLLRLAAGRHYSGKLGKNQIDDHFGGILFLISRLRYPTISLRRLWNTKLLCDRYFHDFLFQGLRFADETPRLRPASTRLRRFIPPPRCLIQLDAPNEVIAERKAELTAEAIDFYRTELFELNLDVPSPYYLYLSTAIPLEHCITTLKGVSENIGVELYQFSAHQAVNAGANSVDLSQAQILGKGHERTCYIDPRDEHKCIKVSRYKAGDRQQNRIEYSYLQSLRKRGVQIDFIPECHGWLETSAGRGLVFDRISDSEGQPARALDAALNNGEIDQEKANALLTELYSYLYDNAIVFADISPDNLLLGVTDEGAHRLYIIDGLGARRYGFKLWLQSRFLWLARRKLNKQWLVLQKKLQELDSQQERG